MTFATETLVKVQAAYQKVLDTGQTVKFNGREWTAHNLPDLRVELTFWQTQVDTEAAQAAGKSPRGPLRFNL